MTKTTNKQKAESRRTFLQRSMLAASGLALAPLTSKLGAAAQSTRRFEVSLHQFSVKPLIDSGQLDTMQYPGFARDKLGLSNIEFAADFCMSLLDAPDKAEAVWRRSQAAGVRNRVLLCTADHPLDVAPPQDRAEAVRQHMRWAKVADGLGCEFIRVRASSEGTPQAQLEYASAGIGALCDAMASSPVSLLVENIAGPSRDPKWLVELVKRVGTERVALLADFGNFDGDVYDGMRQLLPLTKSICAKSWDFDAAGNETKIDYARMMQIIKDSEFRGCIAIEYLGTRLSTVEGIRKSADLIRRHS